MKWTSEADMVSAVSEWLRQAGWTCYHEVAIHGGGDSRADIVATRGPILRVVEAKLTMGLPIIGQALRWRGRANFIDVAVPAPARSRSTYCFGRLLLLNHGIGLLQSDPIESRRWPTMWPYNQGRFFRTTTTQLRDALHPAQQQTPAGAPTFHTPFKATCEHLRRRLSEQGGAEDARTAIKGIAHHYASYASARGALLARCEEGTVPGITVERNGRSVRFVLDERQEESDEMINAAEVSKHG